VGSRAVSPADVGVPAWFEAALMQTPEVAAFDVAGCRINALCWGSRAEQTLVLVHGGAAHANWWSAIAPLLARDHRVVALDLSGHGDSGRREVYPTESWVQEVLGAAEHAGGVGDPIVVGHSMGGFVSIALAVEHGASLGGVMLLDTPVRRADAEAIEGRKGRMFRAPKVYPDLETALDHFHLFPPQPCDNPWMMEHIGRCSLRKDAQGWTWKFDPGVFARREGPYLSSHFGPLLAQVQGRVALVNAELSSVVDDDVRRHMLERLAQSPAARTGIPVIDVPHAHHQMVLDQPLALVAAIRSVLATWQPRVVGGG